MSAATPALLDRFIPQPQVRGRHRIVVHAPANLVMSVARNYEIESLWLVRTLFRMRATLIGGPTPQKGQRAGLVAQMLSLGWKCLAEEPARFFVAGSVCCPWQVDPEFSPIAAEDFVAYSEPDRVKIAWTLEATELGPALTEFATETRVIATDEQSRIKFQRYWRKFGVGIVLIRLILLPALRRQAEQLWKQAETAQQK